MKVELNIKEYEWAHRKLNKTEGCWGFSDLRVQPKDEAAVAHSFFAKYGTFEACFKAAKKRFPNATTLYLLP